MKRLILASGSPRRKELLQQANLSFDTSTSNVSEHISENLLAHELVEHLALQKARAIAKKFPQQVVLGADTIVSFDGQILGKPTNKEEARAMLDLLSGKNHYVLTGCAILSGTSKTVFHEKTKVTFWELSNEIVDWYVSTMEGYDKAGGYGIQGYGALLVKGIQGDYYNVVGLPLSRVVRELAKYDIRPSKSVKEIE